MNATMSPSLTMRMPTTCAVAEVLAASRPIDFHADESDTSSGGDDSMAASAPPL